MDGGRKAARHPDDAVVQLEAMRALMSLASTLAKNRDAIARLGGIETVLAACARHPDAVCKTN